MFGLNWQPPFPHPFQCILRHVLSIGLFALFCRVAHLTSLSYTIHIIIFLCENLYLLLWIVHVMGLFICIWVRLTRLSDFTMPSLSKELHNANWNQVFPPCFTSIVSAEKSQGGQCIPLPSQTAENIQNAWDCTCDTGANARHGLSTFPFVGVVVAFRITPGKQEIALLTSCNSRKALLANLFPEWSCSDSWYPWSAVDVPWDLPCVTHALTCSSGSYR